MTGDAVWYEAAQVVGITNALNVAADALGALGMVEDADAPPETRALFAEIRAFYALGNRDGRSPGRDASPRSRPAGSHGDRRGDADVFELYEDRRHSPARARHGGSCARGFHTRPGRAGEIVQPFL